MTTRKRRLTRGEADRAVHAVKDAREKKLPHHTSVSYTIGGAVITVGELPADKAGPTLAAIIDVVRDLQKRYPELRDTYPTVGGYTAVDYQDDWDWDGTRKRVGFRVKRAK